MKGIRSLEPKASTRPASSARQPARSSGVTECCCWSRHHRMREMIVVDSSCIVPPSTVWGFAITRRSTYPHDQAYLRRVLYGPGKPPSSSRTQCLSLDLVVCLVLAPLSTWKVECVTRDRIARSPHTRSRLPYPRPPRSIQRSTLWPTRPASLQVHIRSSAHSHYNGYRPANRHKGSSGFGENLPAADGLRRQAASHPQDTIW